MMHFSGRAPFQTSPDERGTLNSVIVSAPGTFEQLEILSALNDSNGWNSPEFSGESKVVGL